ncbi:acyl CoA:acetate/3-ketoacid CoA transferase [Sinanaerobacter chloroacetimidivorans]|uniref:Acyl CoA:acetate/3-ketoacid CoA transferase n=1 Tax=Sinanaerobacter chloroacetimidivorans TaxID=2818044 RepID=A0A8J7W4F0_9FIRM|nr:acyl CoA:acetate/3-ketoacid CoA transferase [Sinanaerobacter chloroacetimidivorans]MBR0600156.1 acyl CoA:acetate/3-ketoacid CoA transferase [Sinanaerobacter chloroacetimidivorans]
MKNMMVITAEQAASLVEDGQTVASSGFVGSACPESLTKALEKRFLETGSPKNLTYFYAAAQGNRDGRGADHFAHKGMTKRVIAGHYNTAPSLGKCILNNEIEGYNLPQGTLSQLCRDIAAHKVGTITHVGLNTFVDPRKQGGKLNEITTEDIVEVVDILGEERLLYKSFPIHIVFLRGSYADELGNVTVEREVGTHEVTALAQAAKNSGGKVIVQVERIVKAGTLDPRLVKIPRIYVDALVISEPYDHQQCFDHEFDPSLTGEIKVPVDSLEIPPLSAKKVIGRRAAMELTENTVVNLGIGIPEYISCVANEEGIGDYMTLTVEAGPIGGVPCGGSQFGASVNPECILCQHEQFDFYDGGGVDLAFLGLAQADKEGNINVSKFGPRIAGCGGFINITQNAKRVFYCGTFTAGGLITDIRDGKITIIEEGREKKFIEEVEQITFSGEYAAKIGQPVMYITERAVFELRKDGVYLTEIAPGIDLQTQILDLMDFTPKMDGAPKLMDARIFCDELMGLKK